MQRWRPAPSAGSLVGLLALFVCLAGIAGLTLRTIPAAGDSRAALAGLWGLVALLVLAALALAALLWGYFTLSYAIEDGPDAALVLRWAWTAVRIPLDEIEYFGLARQVLQPTERRWLWPWPGYYLASLDDAGLGRVQLLATLPPRRQLLICSARGSFGISPDRPAQLMDRYQEWRVAARPGLYTLVPPVPARPLAPTLFDDEEGVTAPGLVVGQPAWPVERAGRIGGMGIATGLLRDGAAVALLLAGLALIAAMVWFIVLRFESVPSALPLHYSATGEPDRIGTPREIFVLPLITALVAAANIALAWSVARFDRFAARLLLSGTCLVQLVAWVALLKLF